MKIKLNSEKLIDRFNEYCTIALKGGYVWDEENSDDVLKIISAFEAGDRGICIQGNPGTGKSFILEVLQKLVPKSDPRYFKIRYCMKITDEFSGAGSGTGHDIFKNYVLENICFDDIGFEKKGRHYGGELIEVMEHMVDLRYRVFKFNGRKSHFTTNLTTDDIKKRYGLRFWSRFSEMTDVFVLGNDGDEWSDRRLLRNFNYLPEVYYPIAA